MLTFSGFGRPESIPSHDQTTDEQRTYNKRKTAKRNTQSKKKHQTSVILIRPVSFFWTDDFDPVDFKLKKK
jgi:hypothetical protein